MIYCNVFMKPTFSIIIPALNEEILLPRLLRSLKKQSFKEFEVIVVDANSKDKTVHQATKFKNDLDINIISINHHNVAYSRNAGAKRAKGEYLVFIDADNSLYPNFLENLNRILLKTRYAVVIPSIEPEKKTFMYGFIFLLINLTVSVTNVFGLTSTTGGNIVVLKKVFEKLGGFDPSIFVSEDQDLVKRVRASGLSVKYMRSLVVIFSVRRFEKEGPLLIFKYLISAIYTSIFGKITRRIYSYPMGGGHYE